MSTQNACQTATDRTLSTENRFYDRQDWQGGYRSLPDEYDYSIDDIDGEIPSELEGTLFRNGPGLLEVGDRPVHHPFDGDGMVCAIAFKDGRAHFKNRFVRTEGYIAEQKANKMLYRGVFGTQKSGGWWANAFDLKLKNIANTNVIYWGEKLLALGEAAEPHRLDPATLETIGKDDLNGLLQPGDAFSAHPRIDPCCEMDGGAPCLVNFSVKAGISSTITIYEFNPAGDLLRQHSHAIPGFAFLHDMAITPNYCIFFQNPVRFNPLPFVFGLRGAAECVAFDPSGTTKVVLIPRTPGNREVQILEAPSSFVFHHANAWEEEDKIYVDSIAYDSFPTVEPDADFRELDFDRVPAGQLWRLELSAGSKTVEHRVLESRCCEFPSLHPQNVGRNYRYVYIGAARAETGNAPLQGVLKLDLHSGERQLYSFAPRGFGSEPLFVPRPGGTAEDDGWVLVMVYDAAHDRSDIVILDAGNIDGEPVARLHLKHHVPYGLHGSFTSECFAKSNGL
ncbi:carotenoid oxygenase family protein [Oscillatoriales cyanobacterium LEGE 11467]|uniref:Carotenoid oxygenase family protein n=1 Tax=Zarconia navalis LEGE 11467 TaxID=1828826 RepID=A0A928W1M8_9CYAN|nr:carotenoid oxygenase family protein [Zarconia navalis]MBE9042253.1 carotenoid oxygenase family protein [Zarconia navalis LEGE 11467]